MYDTRMSAYSIALLPADCLRSLFSHLVRYSESSHPSYLASMEAICQLIGSIISRQTGTRFCNKPIVIWTKLVGATIMTINFRLRLMQATNDSLRRAFQRSQDRPHQAGRLPA